MDLKSTLPLEQLALLFSVLSDISNRGLLRALCGAIFILMKAI